MLYLKSTNIEGKTFLETKKGFIHEVFNLRCEYNTIDFWNVKSSKYTNPKLYIKNKVLNYNLRLDLEIGRKVSCKFSDIYLKNVFLYQEEYHLIKPFITFKFFSSIKARSLIIKVLLHPCVFLVDCHLCDGKFKHIFNHYLYECTNLVTKRKHLRNMLNFYSFPTEDILNKEKFLATCLEKKAWTKCLTDFLDLAHF